MERRPFSALKQKKGKRLMDSFLISVLNFFFFFSSSSLAPEFWLIYICFVILERFSLKTN